MALDPQAKMILAQMAAANPPPMNTLTPEEARQSSNIQALAGEPEKVKNVETISIPGPDGELPIRIYTPSGEGPFPVFVYFHGGGWVIGDLDTADVPCRLIANQARCIVVSVDYRLAPEHKFPAATEDAYAAVTWISEHAESLDIDTDRIAVGGDSAGGNLAAVAALMIKDRGGPTLCAQMLIYPVTHYDFNTDSYRDNAEGYFLTKESMVWFWNHYLSSEEDGKHPYASPLLAQDLSGLPPAFVITAQYDPLRDEGEAYAKRLENAGVPVEISRYNGMIHGFFWMPGILTQGRKAIDQVATSLREAFSK